MPVELRSEDQDLVSKDVIASDPGIRTSMTGYSPHCELLQVAKGDAVRMYHLAYALDRLYSKWSQKGGKHGKRWRMRKARCKSKCQDSSTGSRFARKTGQISLHQLFHYPFSKISNLHNDPSA